MDAGHGRKLIDVRIQTADFDAGAEIARISSGHGDVGGVASFIGLCRDEGGRLAHLELEHYPGMARRAILNIAEDAAERFELIAISCIHRYGMIAPGEQIVFVAAAARHRGAAFEGAHYLMDYLKTDAPFWKKEHLVDGTSGNWVTAKDTDDSAKARWSKT